MQSYGYRVIACLVLFLVSMQFVINFSTYHKSLVSIYDFQPSQQLQELQQQQQQQQLQADPGSGGYYLTNPHPPLMHNNRKTFLLQDMSQESQQSPATGSDYYYGSSDSNSNNRLNSASDSSVDSHHHTSTFAANANRAADTLSSSSSSTSSSLSSLLLAANHHHPQQHNHSSNSSQVQRNQKPNLKDCPAIPPALVGRLKVLLKTPSWDQLEQMLPQIKSGGRFRPQGCRSKHRVAVIIPYRDRDDHLRALLHNLHPILSRQQIDYGIFVIEEIPEVKFNRAKLMNIGFVEALKSYDYQCFIFHDVDLLPEDDRNLYTCPDQPRHMSVAVNTMNYKLPYRDIFGGVSALTREQMDRVNGFSNEFWGWGGEDDDMANRVKFHGYRITRYRGEIGRYHMLTHTKDTPNPDRYKKLYKGRQRFKSDGINSLDYKVVKYEMRKLYTWILVDPLYKG